LLWDISNKMRESAMASAQPPPEHHRPNSLPKQLFDTKEIEELREENKQLRDLVIHLSKLVMENVVDRH
jgi:hypothetical protein